MGGRKRGGVKRQEPAGVNRLWLSLHTACRYPESLLYHMTFTLQAFRFPPIQPALLWTTTRSPRKSLTFLTARRCWYPPVL